MDLDINGSKYSINVEPNMPLLWAIREVVGLTGTKYGCGIAQCGACSVMMNGELLRSCSVSVSSAVGQKIITIEGLLNCCQFRSTTKESFSIVNHCSNMG